MLFTKGAIVDQLLPFTGTAGRDYATGLYLKSSGRYLANYFESELQSRDLIDSNFGPPLKAFPFHEDASVIISAMRKFMDSFLDPYYPSADTIVKDEELQAWYQEATGPAEVGDLLDVGPPSTHSADET